MSWYTAARLVLSEKHIGEKELLDNDGIRDVLGTIEGYEPALFSNHIPYVSATRSIASITFPYRLRQSRDIYSKWRRGEGKKSTTSNKGTGLIAIAQHNRHFQSPRVRCYYMASWFLALGCRARLNKAIAEFKSGEWR